MKQLALFKTTIALSSACAALSMGTPIVSAAVIDLTKPAGDSITPDVVYWSFDEGSTGSSTPAATDHSGNGFTGTLKAGTGGTAPPYEAGKFGNGVHITGTSGTARDQHVYWDGRTNNLDATKLDLAGKDFTLGLWLKLNSINKGSAQTIFLVERGASVFTSQTGTQRNFFSLRLTKSKTDSWVLDVMIGDGYQPTVVVSSGLSFSDPNDLEWHHFAFTLQATEEGSNLQFYLDGERLGDEQQTPMLMLGITRADQKELLVGERNASNYQSAFDGVVDDFFITSGAHAFTIPEPSSLALLPLVGISALLARRRWAKR